jgi:cyclic nucleotide-binding protein
MVENIAPLYYVWGIDNIAYGPVELPALVSWVKQERVLKDTWVFAGSSSTWTKATELPELKPLFGKKEPGTSTAPKTSINISPSALRRVKMLAMAEEKLLESLLRYLEPMEVRPFTVLAQPGEPADAMYFLLQGELRAYVVLEGRESTLATLLPGDSFGEIALLDHGVRSAFVSANQPSVLLKLSSISFAQIVREAPALATPFVMGLARALAGRMRSLTKRYEDSVHFSQVGSGH